MDAPLFALPARPARVLPMRAPATVAALPDRGRRGPCPCPLLAEPGERCPACRVPAPPCACDARPHERLAVHRRRDTERRRDLHGGTTSVNTGFRIPVRFRVSLEVSR